jgi:hypothetical protein
MYQLLNLTLLQKWCDLNRVSNAYFNAELKKKHPLHVLNTFVKLSCELINVANCTEVKHFLIGICRIDI